MDFDEILRRGVARISGQLFPSPLKPPAVHIGTNILSGRELYIPIEGQKKGLSSTHTYIPGSSGVGKSKFLERIARDIIKGGYGLIVLDGKGDLYDWLLDFCVLMGLEDKTILIDPNEDEWSVGINYLELLGGASAAALSRLILEVVKKFSGEEDEYKPWLEEWLPAALVPLIETKFTLLELFHFLNLGAPAFREAVLTKLTDSFYRTKWDNLKKQFKPFDQAKMLNVVLTRASTFWQDPALKAIFGQEKTTVDWLKVMNEGGIVLAKLGKTTKVAEDTVSLIGAAILHQVTTVAPLRTQGERRPCFFMVDEFQKFVTSDFADGLERMRGYNIPFIIAHQHRDQFKAAPEILNSIDADCRNKFVFAVSRKDAEDMAGELFGGLVYEGAQEVKDPNLQTKFRPVKTYETIISHTEVDTDSYSSVVSSGFSDGLSETTPLTGDFVFFNPNPTVRTSAQTSTSGSATGSGHAHMSGTTTTKAPWYDYEEFQEGSPTYFSIEEVKARFTAWIQNQDDRHAQWKFKSGKPIPIVTPTMESAIVLDSQRQRFKEKVYACYARPTQEVVREIEERVQKFLESEQGVTIGDMHGPATEGTFSESDTTPKRRGK